MTQIARKTGLNLLGYFKLIDASCRQKRPFPDTAIFPWDANSPGSCLLAKKTLPQANDSFNRIVAWGRQSAEMVERFRKLIPNH